MHVFVTGASGWIGSATVVELLSAGHRVTGLARSTAAADRLRTRGVEPIPGDLDDPESLRRGAAGADAVIHLANKHDWADPASSNRAERAAVQTIGDVLLGSDRPVRALETAPAGSVVHAVAEEGVPTRQIAESIGRGIGLPVTSVAAEDSGAHFGWIGAFFGLDLPASSEVTRERYGWSPRRPTLLEDLDAASYFA